MRQSHQPSFDEIYVREILADVAARRPITRAQFDGLVRPYLAAGYAREVAEAERQYFHSSPQHAA
jgi:hypothetical protein